MKKTVANIIIAYVFHAVIILLDFLLMRNRPGTLLLLVMALDIGYLIYWIVLNRKTYMPWLVFLNFLIGSGVEAALYWWGLTSTDQRPFYGQWEPMTLIIFLIIHALLLGIANFVLWLLEIRRKKQ